VTQVPYVYQQEAVDKFRSQQKALLADEMGLGKTVTAILLDKVRREQKLGEGQIVWMRGGKKMTLVVTLKSLLGMWEDHFAEWAPELKVSVIDTKNRQPFVKSVLDGSADVYVCHWDMLRLELDLRRVRWLHVIADEVHKIKNRKSQVTQSFKNIRAVFNTDMSGTWADNRPDDGWSILNHLYPNRWSSYNSFVNYHIKWKHHNLDLCQAQGCAEKGVWHRTAYKEIVGVHDAEKIQREIEPFYVRRLKADVLASLPDKYYTRLGVDLHPQQRRAYDSMRREMLAWVGEHESEPLAAPIVIAQLMRLQQFAVAFGEMVAVPKKVALDDGTTETQMVRALKLTEPSSKIDLCIDLVENNPDQPMVFFSKSKQVIKLLIARLNKEGYTVGELTGDVSQTARTQVVKDFQSGKIKLFAGTIAAGGVGITLTAASTVIFLDRDWSPSVNKQAEDRLHRIGQKNAVQVIDIIAKDTVDFARLQKIELKWSWLKQILGDK
jgi:SNF2 family DNA or RNA helicase